MTYPTPLDPWKYDDLECESFFRELWWSRTPQPVLFTMVAEGGDPQAEFISQVSTSILDSTFGSVTVRGESRIVEYHVKKLTNDKWYLMAIIDHDNPTKSSSVAISVTPTKSTITDHLIIWVAFWLY